MSPVNPDIVVLARESRGLTQAALAARLGVAQGTLSKIETGQGAPSDDLLRRLADVLDYEPSIFEQDFASRSLPLSYFRKRIRVSARTEKTVRASMNLLRLHVQRLLRSAEIPELKLRPVDPREREGSVEHVAREVRLQWGLPPGPVPNVTQLLERVGILVARCDFGSKQIDGLSVYFPEDGLPPVLIINRSAPGDRARYTLAHELGHLVLHHHIPFAGEKWDIEDEANRFASEFLMPAADIRPHFVRVTLERLASLKAHWKVSMAALLMRAKALGRITEWQATSLWRQLAKLGYRTNEPLPIPAEEPTLLRELVDFHLVSLGYGENELARTIGTRPRQFLATYSAGTTLRVVKAVEGGGGFGSGDSPFVPELRGREATLMSKKHRESLLGGRDSHTGQFIPIEETKRRPDTTQREHIPLPGHGDVPKPKPKK